MTRCATLPFLSAFNTPLSRHIPWCRHHVHVIAHIVSFILKRMLLVLQAWTIYRCFALIRTSSTQSSADVILFLDSLDCIPLPRVTESLISWRLCSYSQLLLVLSRSSVIVLSHQAVTRLITVSAPSSLLSRTTIEMIWHRLWKELGFRV